jgi:glutaredoxin
VKGFLSRAGVPFVVRDVDEDERAHDDLVALGYRTVPLTLVAGRAVRGFDEVALRAALTAAGAP